MQTYSDAASSLPPLARSLVATALVGIVLLLMRLAAPVLTPVMFAFFLAALALPAFSWLQGRGIRRGLALLVLVGALVVGGILLIVLALAAIGHLQTGLAVYSEQLAARLADIEAGLAQRGVDLGSLAGQAASAASSLLGGLLSAIIAAASSAVASVVIVAFFLLESSRLAHCCPCRSRSCSCWCSSEMTAHAGWRRSSAGRPQAARREAIGPEFAPVDICRNNQDKLPDKASSPVSSTRLTA
jgi:hypothetical protein